VTDHLTHYLTSDPTSDLTHQVPVGPPSLLLVADPGTPIVPDHALSPAPQPPRPTAPYSAPQVIGPPGDPAVDPARELTGTSVGATVAEGLSDPWLREIASGATTSGTVGESAPAGRRATRRHHDYQHTRLEIARLARCTVSEIVATFVLIFCGCGAAAVGLPAATVSAAFGLAVTVMIYTLGYVSGAHMNPAVTLAEALIRQLPARDVVPYLGGQAIGALGATALLLTVFPRRAAEASLTLPHGSVTAAATIEVVATAILMFVVLGVCDARALTQFAGLVIGAVVVGLDLVAGPVSGGSLNPARSLAPALLMHATQDWWIYLVAPCGGAVVGAVVYQALRPFSPSAV
jgi:MIP family channel proteins